jgi:hypothetical protein
MEATITCLPEWSAPPTVHPRCRLIDSDAWWKFGLQSLLWYTLTRFQRKALSFTSPAQIYERSQPTPLGVIWDRSTVDSLDLASPKNAVEMTTIPETRRIQTSQSPASGHKDADGRPSEDVGQ